MWHQIDLERYLYGGKNSQSTTSNNKNILTAIAREIEEIYSATKYCDLMPIWRLGPMCGMLRRKLRPLPCNMWTRKLVCGLTVSRPRGNGATVDGLHSAGRPLGRSSLGVGR